MRKNTKLPHRNRGKTTRRNSKLKRKLQRRRLRQSSGERKTYR